MKRMDSVGPKRLPLYIYLVGISLLIIGFFIRSFEWLFYIGYVIFFLFAPIVAVSLRISAGLKLFQLRSGFTISFIFYLWFLVAIVYEVIKAYTDPPQGNLGVLASIPVMAVLVLVMCLTVYSNPQSKSNN